MWFTHLLNVKPPYIRTWWCFIRICGCFPSHQSHGSFLEIVQALELAFCLSIVEIPPVFTWPWPGKLQKHLQGEVKQAEGLSWKTVHLIFYFLTIAQQQNPLFWEELLCMCFFSSATFLVLPTNKYPAVFSSDRWFIQVSVQPPRNPLNPTPKHLFPCRQLVGVAK